MEKKLQRYEREGVPSLLGKVPPHSGEAEEYLLSCCFLDGREVMARCAVRKISSAMFFSPANARIFNVMEELYRSGGAVDLQVLIEELRTRRELEDVGGYGYLMQLSQRTPTNAQLDYFIDKVFEFYMLREAVRFGAGLVEMCHGWAGGDVVELLSGFALKMQRAVDWAQGRRVESLKERLVRRKEMMREEVAGKVDERRQLTFGLRRVDAGFLRMETRSEDWYVIIGGPPSGGKSSVMRQMALENCELGKRGAVFLLETGLRWMDQAAATRARVNLRHRAQWKPAELEKWEEEFGVLEGWAEERLWVFEDIFTIEDIEAKVRSLHRMLLARDLAEGVPAEEARGLDFIVLDYLQIVDTREEFFNGEQKLSHISGTLKRLLKKLDVVGFIGAQINRDARAEGKVPTLAALRGSGSLEQDADRVIFVHTPAENRVGLPQDGLVDEVELVQRKSRNGPRDVSVSVEFHKQYTLYCEGVLRGDARPGAEKPEGGYKRK